MLTGTALPPVRQQSEQVWHGDGAVTVEVGEAVDTIGTRAPTIQKDLQICEAHRTVDVEVTQR